MLHVAVVEDEKPMREELIAAVTRFARESGEQLQITPFESAVLLLTDYQPVYDLILMDISMPMLDGMQAARRLREKDESVLLIFVTALARYAAKGYEVDALDFALKPIIYDELAMKLRRAVRRLAARREEAVSIVCGEDLFRVPVNEISFI